MNRSSALLLSVCLFFSGVCNAAVRVDPVALGNTVIFRIERLLEMPTLVSSLGAGIYSVDKVNLALGATSFQNSLKLAEQQSSLQNQGWRTETQAKLHSINTSLRKANEKMLDGIEKAQKICIPLKMEVDSFIKQGLHTKGTSISDVPLNKISLTSDALFFFQEWDNYLTGRRLEVIAYLTDRRKESGLGDEVASLLQKSYDLEQSLLALKEGRLPTEVAGKTMICKFKCTLGVRDTKRKIAVLESEVTVAKVTDFKKAVTDSVDTCESRFNYQKAKGLSLVKVASDRSLLPHPKREKGTFSDFYEITPNGAHNMAFPESAHNPSVLNSCNYR